jgi:sec-independent protein translocase protein TatA
LQPEKLIYKNISIMQNLAFISMPGGSEWIIILVVVLLLFGGKKIPELMKGIGKGIRGFKDGMKEIEEDIKSDDSESK